MTLAAEAPGEGLAKTLAVRPEIKIIDYTGGPAFGGWLERGGLGRQLVYTEKAGVNSVVIDSTDNYAAMLGNLAFSLSLYSGQMCTAPQNFYVPRDGIKTDAGHLAFEEVRRPARRGVDRQLTGDDAKAVEIRGAMVNDDVRSRAATCRGCRPARRHGRVDARAVTPPVIPRRRGADPRDRRGRRRRRAAYGQECFGPGHVPDHYRLDRRVLERLRTRSKSTAG